MKTVSKKIDNKTKELFWTLQGLEVNVNVWIPLNQLMRFEDDEMMDIIKSTYNEAALVGFEDMIDAICETMFDLGKKKAYVRFTVSDNHELCIDTIEIKSNEFFMDFLSKNDISI